MQQISPVCHDTVFPLLGRKVCAVTQDGKHYYGTISDVRDGRVLLTGCTIGDGPLTLAAAKNENKIKKPNPKKKAKLSGLYDGYGGYGYGYGSYWFPFAFITSLFLLTLFFI
ncbi:hypothetical protein [Cohnella luojiensis]|uniref:Uncharacterized protein n=1 Tax=Cohnella luojiensis TaxID=652876 RepID=A0A4Y8LPH5_9BACL|nr:hypothetical protein [Cohnella luojiensis]TFE19348.1 hypothetical protein E2980_23495 [Cohnella luojiensis]